mgnify:CR=1 FL=1
MFSWNHIQIIPEERKKRIKELPFSKESFRKFTDPKHLQYKDYKDRIEEQWHDRGYNNAIEHVCQILDL